MKKVFTLVLAMTIVITSFAQVRSFSRHSVKAEPAQMRVLTGMEERDYADFPTHERGMLTDPSAEELSYTTYDWQSNAAARNFTAVWPDGYAVMCYTLATDASYSDRGTGLAIWDPAVGEWEYTETRVEGVKTGFGSIARYGENGLVIAAHTSNDCRIFIVEDFRDGNRDFGEGIVMPTAGDDGRTQDPCWPVVQCSGPNLDIVHVICTEYSLATPYKSALLYSRYENNDWTVTNHILPNLDATHVSDGGSNICYFMPYDPAKPNRVSFVLNNSWSDCKAVISEDNGANWTDRVFWQHPGINITYEDWFFYPRWTSAAFDNNDNLHVIYEYNGTTGTAGGDGTYYPAIGGVAYWGETLPKNAMCLGGIGNAGEPFIMDTTYLQQDIYQSEWYWSDALHESLPEYFGVMEVIDEDGNVLPRDSQEGYWLGTDAWSAHGSYNAGKAAFASMYYDKSTNVIYAFWSQIAGDEEDQVYWDEDNSQYYFRVFCNVSANGGRTWEGTKQVLAGNFEFSSEEMVYGQVIPYLYNDEEGDYLWYCYQSDQNTGTFVQEDDTDPSDNRYVAIKVHVNYMWDDVEENNVEVPTTMKVYPNPANGTFTMDLNQESDVNIYNIAGQLVKTYKSVKSLNVNLEAGVYFVQAGNQTQKVVVL